VVAAERERHQPAVDDFAVYSSKHLVHGADSEERSRGGLTTGVIASPESNAACAACTAASTSSGPPSAMVAQARPVKGSMVSNVASDFAITDGQDSYRLAQATAGKGVTPRT
jgi:hypothetical protein